MIILDNIINSCINIYSSLILLNLFDLKKNTFYLILLIDIILYKIPLISISLIILYFINKFIFNKIIINNITKFIVIILDYFIFISLLYLFNEYNIKYLYYIKINYISHIFNILIYYIYIFWRWFYQTVFYVKKEIFII